VALLNLRGENDFIFDANYMLEESWFLAGLQIVTCPDDSVLREGNRFENIISPSVAVSNRWWKLKVLETCWSEEENITACFGSSCCCPL